MLLRLLITSAVFLLANTARGETKYKLPVIPTSTSIAIRANPNDVVYRLPPNEMVPQTMEYSGNAMPLQWWQKQVNAPECWGKSAEGKDVKVAVLDTGCDLNHVDLKGKIVEAMNFTRSQAGASDVQGHGTHTAGIVAGIAPKVSLYIVKVLDDQGSGTSSQIVAGLEYAIAKKVQIVSMSLGAPDQDSMIKAACDKCKSAGILVIAAAGNSGPGANTVEYPGGFESCVCVAATDNNDMVASFSSRGKQVAVAAPGVNVLSAYPGDRRATMSGTSMATPCVAGCVALALSSGTQYTPATLVEALKGTCKDLPPAGRDTATGFGLVQPMAMLATTPVEPGPTPSPTRIELKEEDFTPAGWEKLRKLNPKIDTIAFVLKP